MNIIDTYRFYKIRTLTPIKESIFELIRKVIDSTEDLCYSDLLDNYNSYESLITCKIINDSITFKCGNFSHTTAFSSKTLEELNNLLSSEYHYMLHTNNELFIDLENAVVSIFFECTDDNCSVEKDITLRNFLKDLNFMFPDYEILDELDEKSDKKVSGYVLLKMKI